MKKILLTAAWIVCLLAGLPAQTEELLGTIVEPIKPRFMAVDDGQIYIAEPATVHIYSLANFRKIAQFGKPGGGPEEFIAQGDAATLMVIPRGGELVVSAMGKLNTYTRAGRFLKTTKIQAGMYSFMFYPLDKGFVGTSFSGDEKNGAAFSVNIYDEKFTRLSELNRMPINVGGGKFNPFEMMRRMSYTVDGNRIFVLADDDLSMLVRSATGQLIGKIPLLLEKVPVTPDDIETILKGMVRGQSGAQADQIRKLMEFPDHFPPLLNCIADQDRLYLVSWKKKKEEHLCAVYDIPSGRKLTEVWLPIQFVSGMQPFPYTFKHGYFYRVQELADADEPDEVVLRVVRKKLL